MLFGHVTTSTVCNAQEPAEKRKWIGWGQAYGFYEQDDLKSVNMEGITLEYMSSHRSFKDAMVLGEALLHTRFEHHFNDDQGIYHSVKAQVIHYYYSIGFGRSLEILKSVEHDLIQIGGSVELVGALEFLSSIKPRDTHQAIKLSLDRDLEQIFSLVINCQFMLISTMHGQLVSSRQLFGIHSILTMMK